MTFAQALQAVHDAGFNVHNLFERDVARGLWQANLFKPGERTYSQFGIADTPEGALLDALRGVPAAGPITETRLEPKKGWTGRKCSKCNGTGEHEGAFGRTACNDCGGTGEEYGPITETRVAPTPAKPARIGSLFD